MFQTMFCFLFRRFEKGLHLKEDVQQLPIGVEWCPHISGHTVFEIKRFTCVCVTRGSVCPFTVCERKLKENTICLYSFLLLVLTSFSLFLALCSRCTEEVTGAVVSVTHGFNHSHLPPRDCRYYFFFLFFFFFRVR